MVRKVNGFSDHGLHSLQAFVGSPCFSELQKYGSFGFGTKAAHFVVDKKVRRLNKSICKYLSREKSLNTLSVRFIFGSCRIAIPPQRVFLSPSSNCHSTYMPWPFPSQFVITNHPTSWRYITKAVEIIIIGKTALFEPQPSLEDSARFVWIRPSGFHFFGFRNDNSFTELASNTQPGGSGICLPVTGWPRYTPRHRVPFLRLARLLWGILTRLHTGCGWNSIVKYTQNRSIRPYVLFIHTNHDIGPWPVKSAD
jgi:hypothetical protein